MSQSNDLKANGVSISYGTEMNMVRIFFPNEVWEIIKDYMLYRMDGQFTEYLRKNQKRIFGNLDLKLGYKIYIKFVEESRMGFLKSLVGLSQSNYKRLKMQEEHMQSIDNGEDSSMSSEYSQKTAYKCITYIRKIDKLIEMHDKVSVTELYEMDYELHKMSDILNLRTSREQCRFIQDINTKFLNSCKNISEMRRETKMGKISSIWEVRMGKKVKDVEKIQNLCVNPVQVIEKDDRKFVISFSIEDNESYPNNDIYDSNNFSLHPRYKYHYWKSADKKELITYVPPCLMKIGISCLPNADKHESYENCRDTTRRNELLNFLGFP